MKQNKKCSKKINPCPLKTVKKKLRKPYFLGMQNLEDTNTSEKNKYCCRCVSNKETNHEYKTNDHELLSLGLQLRDPDLMHHKFYNIKQYSYLQPPIFLVLLNISTKLKNYLEHKVRQESSHNILLNFMQNEKMKNN